MVIDHDPAVAGLTWQLNSTTPELPVSALPAPVQATGIRLVIKQANVIWGHLAIYEFTGLNGNTPVVEPNDLGVPDPLRAVDGDVTTTWLGALGQGSGLQVDPGAPQTVRSITLIAPQGQGPNTVRVRVLNGGTWATVVGATALTWRTAGPRWPCPPRPPGPSSISRWRPVPRRMPWVRWC